MITISHHDARYIAIEGAYSHKDAIKALAPYPDVQWSAEAHVWLVRNEMWEHVVRALGPYIAPLPVDFFMEYPDAAPVVVAPRRTDETTGDGRQAQGQRRRQGKWGGCNCGNGETMQQE